jgi:hypothetical protein
MIRTSKLGKNERKTNKEGKDTSCMHTHSTVGMNCLHVSHHASSRVCLPVAKFVERIILHSELMQQLDHKPLVSVVGDHFTMTTGYSSFVPHSTD